MAPNQNEDWVDYNFQQNFNNRMNKVNINDNSILRIEKKNCILWFNDLLGSFIYILVKLKKRPTITRSASYSLGSCPLTWVIAFPHKTCMFFRLNLMKENICNIKKRPSLGFIRHINKIRCMNIFLQLYCPISYYNI